MLWRGDGVSDDDSSRPGKDDEAVDSVASPSRQPLDGDDSALGVEVMSSEVDSGLTKWTTASDGDDGIGSR